MGFIAFIGSIAATAVIASLIPVDTNSDQLSQTDYHFVPAAGDVFGA